MYFHCLLVLLVCLGGTRNQVQGDCRPPQTVPDSQNNAGAGTTFAEESVVDYTCNDGYSMHGYGTFTCIQGRWTGGLFDCRRGCGVSGIENGELQHGIASEVLLGHNQELHWSCNDDFIKVRDDVVCVDGQLSSEPQCRPVVFGTGIDGCLETVPGDVVIRHAGKCYYFLLDSLSKQGAINRCRQRYIASLVVVPDQATMTFLQSALRNRQWGSRDVWLGLTYDDNWRWMNSEEPVAYTNWQSGQGERFLYVVKNEKSAVMRGSLGWRWDDIEESHTRFTWSRGFFTEHRSAYVICQAEVDAEDD